MRDKFPVLCAAIGAIALAGALALGAAGGTASAQPAPAARPPAAPLAVSPSTLGDRRPPPPDLGPIPTAPGCYVDRPAPAGVARRLEKVDCLTPEQIARHPPPTPNLSNAVANCEVPVGPVSYTALPAGPCAFQSVGVTEFAPGGPGLSGGIKRITTAGAPITRAAVNVSLEQYSSSSDTYGGAGAYSVQLNTNNFVQADNHLGWVQFAFQNFPGSAGQICAWDWDTPPGPKALATYQTFCAPTNAVPLSAGLTVTVGAFVCAPTCNVFYGPVGPLNIKAPFLYAYLAYQEAGQAGAASTIVWVVAPDVVGLSNTNNWMVASGTIYGQGTPPGQPGDQLLFVGQTLVINGIQTSGCRSASNQPPWTCAPGLEGIPGQAFNGQFAYSPTTGEGNNLSYANGPNWANAYPSFLSCGDGYCVLMANEIYPKQ
jgi:hypothetical protein